MTEVWHNGHKASYRRNTRTQEHKTKYIK